MDNQSVAFNIVDQLRSLIRQQGFLFLDIGKLLKVMRDEKHYENLGYSKWIDFVNSGEIGIGKSTIYSYIGIYELFILRFGIDNEYLADIPWDKLTLALPMAKKIENREDMEELVEKVRTLSRTDLIISLSENQSDKEEVRTKTVKVFKHDKCGRWIVDMDEKELCRCQFAGKLSEIRDLISKHDNNKAIELINRIIGDIDDLSY
jgi:hypothetical protein